MTNPSHESVFVMKCLTLHVRARRWWFVHWRLCGRADLKGDPTLCSQQDAPTGTMVTMTISIATMERYRHRHRVFHRVKVVTLVHRIRIMMAIRAMICFVKDGATISWRTMRTLQTGV
jgi:hypothetical protein